MVGTDVGGPSGGCLVSAGPRCPIWGMLACGAQRGGPPGSEAVPKVSPAAASPTEPKGGRLCEGSSAPGLRNTLLVFLRFFHLARRFWNHTFQGERDRAVGLVDATRKQEATIPSSAQDSEKRQWTRDDAGRTEREKTAKVERCGIYDPSTGPTSIGAEARRIYEKQDEERNR
ncbi:hypothetical protein HPB50_021901 [Hyalomma asiaticum]|uniref:Uncharacterized protein n=1 Tax=Hyalomma asiaticum TaxID=266040 RepID=A0ACB7SZ34_HYAAI|nr:hypothetical protein HPB50_021901 [Hyalomma asiaticum]